MSVIYKICTAEEWAETEASGLFPGAPVDRADGYIHFSTKTQVVETAARHFTGQDGLLLLTVPADALGPELKWEVSRGGDQFPHLYGELRRAQITRVDQLPLGPDGHIFPDHIAP